LLHQTNFHLTDQNESETLNDNAESSNEDVASSDVKQDGTHSDDNASDDLTDQNESVAQNDKAETSNEDVASSESCLKSEEATSSLEVSALSSWASDSFWSATSEVLASLWVSSCLTSEEATSSLEVSALSFWATDIWSSRWQSRNF
jgi:bifunctional autolysin